MIPSSGVIVVADTGNQRIRLISVPLTLPACDVTWHHVALTYFASASISAYIDGALTLQQSTTVTLPTASASTLRIGWSGNLTTNGGSLFAGTLSELRIYNRTLSASEVVALSQPLLPSFPNAVSSPSVPTASAINYSFSCVAGSAGVGGSLVKSSSSGSWTWAGGVLPSCVSSASAGATSPPVNAAAIAASVAVILVPLAACASYYVFHARRASNPLKMRAIGASVGEVVAAPR